MSPYLPITPEEIARQAVQAAEAGASAVHIHVRVPKTGQPTMDLGLFQEVCQEIHRKSDAAINITTGGSPTMTPEERMVGVRRFKPELASINMGTINFGLFRAMERIKDYKHAWEKPYLESSKDFVFKNTFYDQERIFKIMEDNGTKPEMECYDMAHLYSASYWAEKGILKPPFWLQLIFGIMGGIQPSIDNLVFMKNTAEKLLGDQCIWSTLAAGRHEYSLCTAGILMGGHARVGLEDNLYLQKGVLAENNAAMVDKMARIVREFDQEVAAPEDIREILKLKGKSQTAFQ
jgi:uncharacterized protein (DUF849 family)